MGKIKKPFIDKKKAVTYHAIPRSNCDPKIHDNEEAAVVFIRDQKKSRAIPEEEDGFGYEDEYDYSQHLKTVSELRTIELNETIIREYFEKDKDGVEHSLTVTLDPHLDELAIDADVAHALNKDFDETENDDELEDDFIDLAGGELVLAPEDFQYFNTNNDDEEYDDSDAEDTENFQISRFLGKEDPVPELPQFKKKPNGKSVLTGLSMTSSVLSRSKGLESLDEQFENMLGNYSEDKIGGLFEEEIEGEKDEIPQKIFEEAVADFSKEHARKKPQKEVPELDQEESDRLQIFVPKMREFDSLTKADIERTKYMAQYVKDEPKIVVPVFEKPSREDRHDCETILSTYSTLYNRPTVISESSRKVTSSPTGENDDDDSSSQTDDNGPYVPMGLTLSEVQDLTKNTGHPERVDPALFQRCRGEALYEKKLRKQMIKALQRERRVEKKNTKVGFTIEEQLHRKQTITNPNLPKLS